MLKMTIQFCIFLDKCTDAACYRVTVALVQALNFMIAYKA